MRPSVLPIVLLLCALPGPLAAEEKAPVTHAAFLDQLAPIIETSIKRKDTQHAVFHGCYDWHSAVHGHWALLRLDRVTKRHEARARHVAAVLDGKALTTERELLAARPSFEMPYGRAWFLRLAIERDQWADTRQLPTPALVHGAAADVAKSLRTWLAERTFDPDVKEYANQAWAATQLYDWYRHRKDQAGAEWVRGWIAKSGLAAEPKLTYAQDAGRREFFSRRGNWDYAVAITQPAKVLASFLKAHPLPEGTLPPVTTSKSAVHELGMNWSRAWTFTRLLETQPAAAVAARLKKALAAHIEAGQAAHKVHVGRYLAYDHWVPQFAVYALTERAR